MHSTIQRRDEIARIIRETSSTSQQEILDLLGARGFEITQPTLSRDLRELGAIKSPDGYVLPDSLLGATVAQFTPRESREERFDAAVQTLVISAIPAGNLIVLRTPPAEAQPLARAIDDAALDGIVGSIGGDDTVFVATVSARTARALSDRIHASLSSPTRKLLRTRP